MINYIINERLVNGPQTDSIIDTLHATFLEIKSERSFLAMGRLINTRVLNSNDLTKKKNAFPASEEQIILDDAHVPGEDAKNAFEEVAEEIKETIRKSRRSWKVHHESSMWHRAVGLSDDELTSFSPNDDLVLVRNGQASYGHIIFGKLRLPAINDELGEGFIHVRCDLYSSTINDRKISSPPFFLFLFYSLFFIFGGGRDFALKRFLFLCRRIHHEVNTDIIHLILLSFFSYRPAVRDHPGGNYMRFTTSRRHLTRTAIPTRGVPSILMTTPWSSLSITPNFMRRHRALHIGESESWNSGAAKKSVLLYYNDAFCCVCMYDISL